MFIASDKWEVLREAICDWSVRSVELMREIRQRVDAKNPMTNRELCERLSVFPLVGEFHSWQMATDMFCMSNNGMIVLEDDFLWPGPGAKKGLEMFNVPKSAPPDQVRTLLEQVNKYLASTGLERYVPGSRSLDAPIIPLQINIIELEHTLCEFSKYVKFVRDGAPRNRRSTEWLAWQEAGRAQEEAGDGGAEEAQEEPRDNGSSQDGRDDESVTGTKRKPPQRDELYGVEESEESTGRLRKRVKREFFPFSPSKAEVKAKIKTELLSITVKQEPQDESDSEDTVYEVEAITNHGEDEGELLFQIKWARHRRRTWEPESNLDGCQALLKAYKKKHKI